MDVFPHQDLHQPRPRRVKHSRTLLNPPANTEQHLALACTPTKDCICSQKENIMYFRERLCFTAAEHKKEPSVATQIQIFKV